MWLETFIFSLNILWVCSNIYILKCKNAFLCINILFSCMLLNLHFVFLFLNFLVGETDELETEAVNSLTPNWGCHCFVSSPSFPAFLLCSGANIATCTTGENQRFASMFFLASVQWDGRNSILWSAVCITIISRVDNCYFCSVCLFVVCVGSITTLLKRNWIVNQKLK